jgi:hypothetical protein
MTDSRVPDPMSLLFDADEISKMALSGKPPLLDSFAASVAMARIGVPQELRDWFETIKVIPAFATYSGWSYYRFNGCQDFIPSPLTPETPMTLHATLGEYGFAVHLRSHQSLERCNFYEYFPAILAFGLAGENVSPPPGGQGAVIDGQYYFRLFHHTTDDGHTGILASKSLNGSYWNFCGTRRLASRNCYLTDVPSATSVIDTLPILIPRSGTDVLFRTDDQSEILRAGVKIDDRQLTRRIAFLVSPKLIQPNPMVGHHEIDKQPKWLEIMFPRVFRCPCSALRLERSVMFAGESHWVIDESSAADWRKNDPICWADGNDPQALLRLIDDCYMPSQ